MDDVVAYFLVMGFFTYGGSYLGTVLFLFRQTHEQLVIMVRASITQTQSAQIQASGHRRQADCILYCITVTNDFMHMLFVVDHATIGMPLSAVAALGGSLRDFGVKASNGTGRWVG